MTRKKPARDNHSQQQPIPSQREDDIIPFTIQIRHHYNNAVSIMARWASEDGNDEGKKSERREETSDYRLCE